MPAAASMHKKAYLIRWIFDCNSVRSLHLVNYSCGSTRDVNIHHTGLVTCQQAMDLVELENVIPDTQVAPITLGNITSGTLVSAPYTCKSLATVSLPML